MKKSEIQVGHVYDTGSSRYVYESPFLVTGFEMVKPHWGYAHPTMQVVGHALYLEKGKVSEGGRTSVTFQKVRVHLADSKEAWATREKERLAARAKAEREHQQYQGEFKALAEPLMREWKRVFGHGLYLSEYSRSINLNNEEAARLLEILREVK